jgi:hypothetical protein
MGLHQRGDRELTVTFPPDQVDAAADLLGCRRRRQLTDAQRERLAALAAEYRFARQ